MGIGQNRQRPERDVFWNQEAIMTHQVIAFTRPMRATTAESAAFPLMSAAKHPDTVNQTVALTIALRYLASRNRIPPILAPGMAPFREPK